MAAIHDLLAQIQDEGLRERIEQEVDKLKKNKKFGLVFEQHLPECTPLYGVPIKVGSKIMPKNTKDKKNVYTVIRMDNEFVVCCQKDNLQKSYTYDLKDVVRVAEFGEPIYPYLEKVDLVYNAPKSDLWHTLIEADNYHALQLLEYLYPGKVDCIYIDPPYNTGAKDWKYNNDYVDGNDAYRHSKWLSMMARRLQLAKKVLNPTKGVLICTIDEHEVHHLRSLLEEMFPEAFIQMATIVINQKGVAQGRLARVEEYAIYVFMPNAFVDAFYDDYLSQTELSTTIESPRWERLLRGGNNSRREDRPKMFYPVFIDPEKKKVTGIGPILPIEETPDLDKLDDRTVAWPFRKDGSLGHWQLQPSTFQELLNLGYVKVGTYDKKRKTWTILYLNKGTRKRIDDGEIIITGRDKVTGSVSIEFSRPEAKMYNIKTVWYRKLHDSGVYGSTLLSNIIGREVKFDFPKALYSTKDAIASIVRNNPNALVLDFFAGSGTTLNAINLLNKEDGGHRRCILVTNNECSDADSQKLKAQGYCPGDEEWNNKGICRSVTWPRTKNTILGKNEKGMDLEGEYYTSLSESKEISRCVTQVGLFSQINTIKEKKELISLICKGKLPTSSVKEDCLYAISDNNSHTASVLFSIDGLDDWLNELDELQHITDLFIVESNYKIFEEAKEKILETLSPLYKKATVKFKMSDGFQSNVIFFKLGFLDKTSIALGLQFKEMLSMLWMKAGAIGKCPETDFDELPDVLVYPENRFAVLLKEESFSKMKDKIKKNTEIDTVFIVTDYEVNYQSMVKELGIKKTYQLYRDYLDNFRINQGRI